MRCGDCARYQSFCQQERTDLMCQMINRLYINHRQENICILLWNVCVMCSIKWLRDYRKVSGRGHTGRKLMRKLQSDTSGCSPGFVDTKAKVAF